MVIKSYDDYLLHLGETYLLDFITIIKYEGSKAIRRHFGASNDRYSYGYALVFSRIISLMLEQAKAYNLPLNELFLDDINSDEDLLLGIGTYNYVQSQNNKRNYLLDLIYIIKNEALVAVKEYNNSRAKENDDEYKLGLAHAYSRIVSILLQQTIAFNIPLSKLGLDDINPDKNLLEGEDYRGYGQI